MSGVDRWPLQQDILHVDGLGHPQPSARSQPSIGLRSLQHAGARLDRSQHLEASPRLTVAIGSFVRLKTPRASASTVLTPAIIATWEHGHGALPHFLVIERKSPRRLLTRLWLCSSRAVLLGMGSLETAMCQQFSYVCEQ
jgi:hypothetical protein